MQQKPDGVITKSEYVDLIAKSQKTDTESLFLDTDTDTDNDNDNDTLLAVSTMILERNGIEATDERVNAITAIIRQEALTIAQMKLLLEDNDPLGTDKPVPPGPAIEL